MSEYIDFIRETGTEKTVLITMITSYGLAPGGYSDDIQCQLTMADLFTSFVGKFIMPMNRS